MPPLLNLNTLHIDIKHTFVTQFQNPESYKWSRNLTNDILIVER
jgi:hypothetical protein